MLKQTLICIFFLLSVSNSFAGKIIKGGSILISNQNLSDISYGPEMGQTMNRVKKDYGKPLKVYPAIGKPPISRWKYTDFTVFFENKFVIQSVLNQQKRTQK